MTDIKHKRQTVVDLIVLDYECCVLGPLTAASRGVWTTPVSCCPTTVFRGAAVPYKSSFPSSSSQSPTAKGSRSSAGLNGSHFLLSDGPPAWGGREVCSSGRGGFAGGVLVSNSLSLNRVVLKRLGFARGRCEVLGAPPLFWS